MWPALFAGIRRLGGWCDCDRAQSERSSTGRDAVSAATALPIVDAAGRFQMDTGLMYPPTDPGLPAVAVEAIVDELSTLMQRARRATGGDEAFFDRYVRRPVHALASEVHLLPATACGSFAGPGGLLRQALECAMQCVQSSRGRLFTPDRSAQERHVVEPRWRLAAFLAGLTCDLSETLNAIVVCDDAGCEWPMESLGLSPWLVRSRLARYHLSWLSSLPPSGPTVVSAAIIGRIVSAEVLAWLRAGDPETVTDLVAIGQGSLERKGSRLGPLVREVRVEVRKIDEARRASRYGRLRVGHHLEIHLLDALRTRIERDDCATEIDDCAHVRTSSLLVCRGEAVFLRWPEGAAAIVDELTGRGLPGFPRSSRTLLECLATAGLLDSRADGDWLWPLPPDRGGGSAVKFSDARVLLPAGMSADGPGGPETMPFPASEMPRDDTTSTPAIADDACVDRWRRAWAAEPGCDVLVYEDGRVAVSHRLASVSHPEPVRLLASLRERGWLAEPDGSERGVRAGCVRFRDGQRPAFVLTAAAARSLRIAC